MSSPITTLAALWSSTTGLLHGLDAEHWSDSDVRAPSLLPDWTRGHVLTHLARNADGIALTLTGGLRGEILMRYPDGRAGRNADIEAGAGRTAAALLADVRDSAEALDLVFTTVADAAAWDTPTEKQQPASHWIQARWMEVEIHRVDVGGTYTAADWPASFVESMLAPLIDGLGTRTASALRIQVAADGSTSTALAGTEWTVGTGSELVDVTGPDWAVLAWLLGRPSPALSASPELAPWL